MAQSPWQGPWLTFNETLSGGSLAVPGVPDKETEEAERMLREPMRLKTNWCLFEQPVASGAGQGNYSIRKTATFGTAQDFFRVWNGVPQPSELLDGRRFMREGSNGQSTPIDALMIFREGISPEWEDKANAKAGHFQIVWKPSAVGGGGQIDEYWNNIVLGMIGETLDPNMIITGVRLVDKLTGISGKGKPTDAIRLELWYHAKSTAADQDALKRNLERCLTTRLDGSTGSSLQRDAITDKKH